VRPGPQHSGDVTGPGCRAARAQADQARDIARRLTAAGKPVSPASVALRRSPGLKRGAERPSAHDQQRASRSSAATCSGWLTQPASFVAFAGRARRELAATVDTVTALTAQEAYIARLARDGRTDAEIGAQPFLSVRTVEWHLRKIFIKLGIGSRRELRTALDNSGQTGRPPRSRAGCGHARIRMLPSATCTSYTLSGRAAGPWTTAPVVTSHSEPWRWHMISSR
jgi:DNA-binding CsgD family transcriptional regulator